MVASWSKLWSAAGYLCISIKGHEGPCILTRKRIRKAVRVSSRNRQGLMLTPPRIACLCTKRNTMAHDNCSMLVLLRQGSFEHSGPSTDRGARIVVTIVTAESLVRIVAHQPVSDRPELWGKRVKYRFLCVLRRLAYFQKAGGAHLYDYEAYSQSRPINHGFSEVGELFHSTLFLFIIVFQYLQLCLTYGSYSPSLYSHDGLFEDAQ